MRFFVSGDFSTVGIGHRFALQGGFKTFFDKTLLELLDFFGGHCIRRRFSTVHFFLLNGDMELNKNRQIFVNKML